MMPDALVMAGAIDRMRRRVLAELPGVSVHEVAGGWMTFNPETAGQEFPSTNRNRVQWNSSPVTGAEVTSALATARGLGVRRLFFWAGPGAWREGLDADLARIGAREWPHVRYLALARAAGEIEDHRCSPLTARAVVGDEVPRMLEAARAWIGDSGVEGAMRLVNRGTVELHAAFDGEQPVAIASLMVDGDWAYLGFASTAAEHRGRGGQTGLIRSRVKSAAERGVKWCTSETNTAVPISLRNLKLCGFEERFDVRVFVWAADGTA